MAKKQSEEQPDAETAAHLSTYERMTGRPMKVQLTKNNSADWAGGHESIPVGDGTAFDMELGETGILFIPRGKERKRAYWIPFTQVRFIEYATE